MESHYEMPFCPPITMWAYSVTRLGEEEEEEILDITHKDWKHFICGAFDPCRTPVHSPLKTGYMSAKRIALHAGLLL